MFVGIFHKRQLLSIYQISKQSKIRINVHTICSCSQKVIRYRLVNTLFSIQVWTGTFLSGGKFKGALRVVLQNKSMASGISPYCLCFDERVEKDFLVECLCSSNIDDQRLPSVGDVYESVPLQHFSKDIVFSIKGDWTYVDSPYHVYVKTFVSSRLLNENGKVSTSNSRTKIK